MRYNKQLIKSTVITNNKNNTYTKHWFRKKNNKAIYRVCYKRCLHLAWSFQLWFQIVVNFVNTTPIDNTWYVFTCINWREVVITSELNMCGVDERNNIVDSMTKQRHNTISTVQTHHRFAVNKYKASYIYTVKCNDLNNVVHTATDV